MRRDAAAGVLQPAAPSAAAPTAAAAPPPRAAAGELAHCSVDEVLLWLQTHAFRKRGPDAAAALPAADDGGGGGARRRHRERIRSEILSIRQRSSPRDSAPPTDDVRRQGRPPLAELSA